MKEYDYKAIPAPSGEKDLSDAAGKFCPCYDKGRRGGDV